MRAPSLLVLSGLLAWALPALAVPPPKLLEARTLIDDLEMEAALKALDAADKTEGNDRATVLEILTLQGIAFGSLGKDAKTRDSFRKLLMLAPDAKLPADQPPRVRTPFFEAKEWANSNGPLTATPGFDAGSGLVSSVRLTFQKDVLRQARLARFHLKTVSGEQTLEVPIAAGKAEVPVGKPAVSWWAEVLNERKSVLLEVGSAASPREDLAPGAVSLSAVASVAVEAEGPVSGGWRRPTGFVLLGAGVVAAGVGVLMGVQSAAARAKLTGAVKDDLGRVTGLTQRDAAAVEAGANTQATVANLLFGVGGALGATGLVLVILGPSTTGPSVALAPAPGGVVMSGAF